MKVLLLGGTAEAADMAARLHELGVDVMTSLAGRTREPAPLKGKVRVGGFGGAEGLGTFMLEQKISLLIDMTHPFANRMSENAKYAAAQSGIPLLAFQRPGWDKMEGDSWIAVQDATAAIKSIPPHSRVLLALGSQHIAPFAVRADAHFLVRMVDKPEIPLSLPDHELLLAKPGNVEQEFELLNSKIITHIVCRNSGGKASYTKIAAARLLGIPVIMIDREPDDRAKMSLEAFESSVLAALN